MNMHKLAEAYGKPDPSKGVKEEVSVVMEMFHLVGLIFSCISDWISLYICPHE